MKKLFAIAAMAALLTACDQGGTGRDQGTGGAQDTGVGTGTGSAYDTNYNQGTQARTNEFQGSQGGTMDQDSSQGTMDTNAQSGDLNQRSGSGAGSR
jgi:hypothetical protein